MQPLLSDREKEILEQGRHENGKLVSVHHFPILKTPFRKQLQLDLGGQLQERVGIVTRRRRLE